MPSAAGGVRKEFDCGTDSGTASAAAKASEWTEEEQGGKVRTWRRLQSTKKEEKEMSVCRQTGVSDEGGEEEEEEEDRGGTPLLLAKTVHSINQLF